MDGLHQLISSMKLGTKYEAAVEGHRAVYDHISCMIKNDPAYKNEQAPPFVIFYAMRNILHPSFILGQIPDLLDLLAMIDIFRRHAVKVSSNALAWQEYYTIRPSSDMRLLTEKEINWLESYVAKDGRDRLLYILLIKNMCLLHVYYLITSPESSTLAQQLNDYFPGCFPSHDMVSTRMFHSGLSDGEKDVMEKVYQACKAWLTEVTEWEVAREQDMPATLTAEQADAAFQESFREKFPPPLSPEELASDLQAYLEIVEGMIRRLEEYFPCSLERRKGRRRLSST